MWLGLWLWLGFRVRVRVMPDGLVLVKRGAPDEREHGRGHGAAHREEAEDLDAAARHLVVQPLAEDQRHDLLALEPL